MKKFFVWVFIAVSAALAGCCTHKTVLSPHDTIQLAARLQDETVALVMTIPELEGEYRMFCSGVWVNYDKILTANHCVADVDDDGNDKNMVGTTIRFITHDDSVSRDDGAKIFNPRFAKVVSTDKEHDLALLKVDADTPRFHYAATIDKKEVIPVGMHVNVVGHTVGLVWSYSEGYVAGIRTPEGMKGKLSQPDGIGVKVIQTTATTGPGNSGGGIFDDDGNIIGICSFGMHRGPQIGFFVHHDVIVEFLREAHVF
jgi:hypothetical protein